MKKKNFLLIACNVKFKANEAKTFSLDVRKAKIQFAKKKRKKHKHLGFMSF